MKSLRAKFQEVAESIFNRELKNLSLSAHKWLVGAFADYHSDNTELDGTPNAWRENKLVTILYLNDDYEGGELVFKDHPIKISPKAGTLVVFDVGFDNIHAVTEVTSGTRWTMLSSFDYADSEYPESYWEEKRVELEETAKIHEKQHAEWETSGMPKERVFRHE
jgi:predicted 2-oxoglutarate/Fe(II)-dependent dioxygenase YbiX